MKTQSKLILATALSFVFLSANTAMASENSNTNGDSHHSLFFSGGSENNAGAPVATYKNTEHHQLKSNGGSENDSSPVLSAQTDTGHHKEVIDSLSIDYLSTN